MSGSNLPPGCSVNDIPGNRPEDLLAEARADALYDILDKYFDIKSNPDAVDNCVEDLIAYIDNEVNNAVDEVYSDFIWAKEFEG